MVSTRLHQCPAVHFQSWRCYLRIWPFGRGRFTKATASDPQATGSNPSPESYLADYPAPQPGASSCDRDRTGGAIAKSPAWIRCATADSGSAPSDSHAAARSSAIATAAGAAGIGTTGAPAMEMGPTMMASMFGGAGIRFGGGFRHHRDGGEDAQVDAATLRSLSDETGATTFIVNPRVNDPVRARFSLPKRFG